MSFDAQKYNEKISHKAKDNAELKSIRLDIPQYVYDIIEESANKWDTHKTNATIRLIRSGDFLRSVVENEADIIVRNKEDGNETLINLD